MDKKLVCYTCCLIVLSYCVDQGDGHWKKRVKESLQHEIDIFKRMTEQNEHEIELFYEDLEEQNDERVEDQVNKQNLKNLKAKGNVDTKDETISNLNNTAHDNIINDNDAVTTHLYGRNNDDTLTLSSNFKNTNTKSKYSNPAWPKFEDILLEMGTKYDWKNDRWIKVKRKQLNMKTKNIKENKLIIIHEKHNFNYRTVKLNRSKSRRNVVIAVSAVR